MLLATASTWSQIESGIRNYVTAPERRAAAALALQRVYGVNVEYVMYGNEPMFIREPEAVMIPVTPREGVLNFQNKAEKRKVLEELDGYKAQIIELEAALAECLAKLALENPKEKKKK